MSVPPLLFLELACNLENSQHIYMLLKDMMSEWTSLRGCKALTTNSDLKHQQSCNLLVHFSPLFDFLPNFSKSKAEKEKR